MSEIFLDALMQIFALLTDIKKEQETGEGRLEVKQYLSRNFNNEYVEQALELYDLYLNKYHKNSYSHNQSEREQQSSYNLNKLMIICNQLNLELEQETKFILMTIMLNFIIHDNKLTPDEELFTDALAENLKINATDYKNLKCFTVSEPILVEDKDRLLLISGDEQGPNINIKYIYNHKQQVKVWILHLKSPNIFVFRYYGERNLYLNGHKIEQNKTVVFPTGSVVKTSRMTPVYYSQVSEKFITQKDLGLITFRAVDISYKFSNNQIGIQPFSFLGRSGQLVGVIGGSGTGKSTLLNVLNGNLKLNSGKITINGYDLETEKDKLQGVIGYVPQDDLLKEELTVFENLYYNAQLCFSHLLKPQIAKLVDEALKDFDLVEARNLVVGSPINKILSGGQRKRLNIALELIREPSILFVDEPTSGLSSMDSEKVMVLLKRQAIKGKLVFINIHQPSSDLFKLIDKLLIIDKGGRIIYNGNPMDSIAYFKKMSHYVNPEERECYACGNVQTEQPLRIIEARMVNPYGKFIRQRKVSPEEWYESYTTNFEEKFDWKSSINSKKKEKLPHNLYNIPGRFKQFKIYTVRDALSKLKDKQYLLINLVEAPILALILGFFTKFISGTESNPEAYVFWKNDNLPAYLFMSVVVSIFMGLNISAEEIIKDKRLLKRESFLNLSRSSYLNSKITILLLMSAIQTLSFVLIGNYILEIQGLNFSYWIILFSTSCFANLLGLNISSGLNSVVAIYIIIPLILVPQLLFSGVIVDFNKLHKSISSIEFVPRIGDLMASRWAYEALAVNQYKNNKYEKHFFDAKKEMSRFSYSSSLLIPKLEQLNLTCKYYYNSDSKELLAKNFQFLNSELNQLENKFPDLGKITSKTNTSYNIGTYNEIDNFLQESKTILRNKYRRSQKKKDQIYHELLSEFGSKELFITFKETYQNEALQQILLNNREIKQIETIDNHILQKKHPIYKEPKSNYGRAHFYAPDKKMFGINISTPIFNVLVIWLSSICLYFTLYLDVLKRIIAYFDMFKLRRLNKRLQKLRT